MEQTRAANTLNGRLQVAAGWGISAVLLATLIVAASVLGTSILGVPTYYGSGVDSTLGAQVARDFLADQQAQASALSSGDQGPLGGHFTDSALGAVIQQITSSSASGAAQTFSFQPATLTVLRASDPNNLALTLEVREDGTETVVTTPTNAAPSEQSISFHGDYWLRIPSGSHYAIADMNFQALPSSPVGAIATIAAALLAVGLAALLFIRQRRVPAAIPRAADGRPLTVINTPTPISEPVHADELVGPAGPEPAIVVTTFGGLHVQAAGKDWAPDLMSRSVTGFVWLRLLVAAIRDPKAQPGREEIARQASPPGVRRDQLKRLRNVTSRGLKELPGPLGGRIMVEPETLAFNLNGCAVDAIELLAVSKKWSGRSQLPVAEIPRVQRVIDACRGDFLLEFDTLENIATDRHPTCTALIAELRQLLVNRHTDLSLLLAEALLRDGRTGQAIAVLEPALRARAERKDIADRLASAYRAAGREAEAKALAARYA